MSEPTNTNSENKTYPDFQISIEEFDKKWGTSSRLSI